MSCFLNHNAGRFEKGFRQRPRLSSQKQRIAIEGIDLHREFERGPEIASCGNDDGFNRVGIRFRVISI
jgi:hypothetical protein